MILRLFSHLMSRSRTGIRAYPIPLVIACLLLAPPVLAQQIERVEPPFWYQGFKDRSVQIMMHGEGLGALTPSIAREGIRIDRVETVDSPNYLFVYLGIEASVEPGDFDIVLEGPGVELTHRYELRARNPDTSRTRGFDRSDAIYLITPDRFVNGDPANDNLEGMGDEVDRNELCGRHGGDIAGISKSLPYIKDLGFTSIWLNPVLENRMERCSYHGYSTTDFYQVDPRYGSNEEYRQLAEKARSMNISLIMDMIVNHIGSGHWWMDDLPAKDWLNFPELRPATNHAHAAVMDPYASRYDLQAFADGWFVDTMPDLNQRNPLLADYLTQNALWWIEFLGLAGIRMDTYPYPDAQYMTEWTRRVMEEYPDFNVVGEEWNSNPQIVSYWQRGKNNHDGYISYLPSLMDFPVQEKMAASMVADVPAWGSSWTPLYESLALDPIYPDPFALVIFPDNHDMSRIFTQLNEDEDLFRMAMVFVATMRGTPQFYYGTEILMANRASDDHGLIRSDFPGGWEGDLQNAFTGAGLSEAERDAQAFVKQLLAWRREAQVVHEGRLMQFTPIGEVYVYFRYDEEDTVMVIFNKNETPLALPTSRFAERLKGAERATDVLTGRSLDITERLQLPPRSSLLLEIHH